MTTSIQTSRLHKQIQNTNRQIIKKYENKHSANIKIQTILGIEHSAIDKNQGQGQQFPQKNSFSNRKEASPIVSLNDEQILYYSCKYFVIFNLSTKEYQIINKDIRYCKMVQMRKFNTNQNDRKIIVCIYQTQNTKQSTFLGILTLKTDYESRTSRNDSRYDWKVIKFYNQPVAIEDYYFLSNKSYLYLVATKQPSNSTQNEKTLQYLWVYDLNKEIMLINRQIRSNTVGFYIKNISLQDSNVVYLVGRNYFRQWTLNFNERSIKESNFRNVQRLLKNKTLVDVQQIDRYCLKPQNHADFKAQLSDFNAHLQHSSNQHILNQPSKLLLILTQKELLLVKNNEIVCMIKPEKNLLKTAKNKENIEKQLQNSFNQIYKMKFLFDQYQELKQKEDNYRRLKKGRNTDTIIMNQQKDIKFSCISKCWKSQSQNYYFAIATNKYNVLIYELIDFQMKLYTEYNYIQDIITSSFKTIIPSQAGDLLLIMSENKEVHLINQQNFDPEDDIPIKSLWGNGQMHAGKIHALTSPVIQNIMCTVGQDGTFKLWSMKKNQRSILFQYRPPSKPLGITIHPGGTMIGVNFEREIKLFSILPKQFYEITSIKTNYSSLQLKYSHRGEFLVSNEGSVLIFYEPFSLITLGYLQPADLKSRIVDFRLSSNAEYICFLTEDNATYFQPIQIGQLSKWEHFLPSHRQAQSYTAFYFDLYTNAENSQTNAFDQRKAKNLFLGATKTKYMVLYDDLGSKLIAQFPVIDCHIVDIEVHENLLFAATSKGTVRVYSWPILQGDLQLQIMNSQEKQIRYKPPKYDELQIWNQSIPLKKIHKLKFSNELVVCNDNGNLCVLSFQQTKNKKVIYEQISGDRKKMEQLINQMFYIKKSQAQKRNKLIEKTQNDILKVQNEIIREKISLEKKMQQQQLMAEKGFQIKNHIQQNQKKQYIQKQAKQIAVLKKQISLKTSNFEELQRCILQDYETKKLYEKGRNQHLNIDIKDVILRHKERISKKMEIHKENIKNKNKQYFLKVKQVQKQFQDEVQQSYQNKIKQMPKKADKSCKDSQDHILLSEQRCANSAQDNLILPRNVTKSSATSSNLKRMSLYGIKNQQKQINRLPNQTSRQIKSMEQELNEEIIEQFTSKQNQEIVLQSCRVQELQNNNCNLQKQIQALKHKVEQMENEDENLQKDFQKNLEDYNLSRFQNLNLHSEVLKMQNQLIQRKQVLDNKEEIVMLAYQQKEKLENYKELVKGSLSKLQQKKETVRDVFFKKQNDLNLIFSQLFNEIHKMQTKKCLLQKLQGRILITQKQNSSKQMLLNEVIEKLKQLKKYLLLQQSNEQKSQKSLHQYEQNLINTINFLKKRLYMESIKEKKNKQLKKSASNQILKQNKNLLEECNQLRSEGIQYENEIKNLSNKLKQANKMISIQTKLKSQKGQVCEQKNQLTIIKQLFKMQLNQFDQVNDEGNFSNNGQNDESQVYYDAERPKFQKSKFNRVVFKDPKSFKDHSSEDNFTEHKTFKLSGYIEAGPFQKIQI